ncbi:MAG: cyclic nucleotide-binding domain-containing protein [Acidobacteriota bacterium]
MKDERQFFFPLFCDSNELRRHKLNRDVAGGKECRLAIHGPGDVFGELCLSGLGGRLETAPAIEDSSLKEIPCDKFLERLAKESTKDSSLLTSHRFSKARFPTYLPAKHFEMLKRKLVGGVALCLLL